MAKIIKHQFSKNHEALFEELRKLLGEEYVVIDKDEVDQRAQVTIHERTVPLAYVYPADSDQVQGIVDLANKYKTPIWASSGGRNWGYGAATTLQENSVVIILERMNRILEVNEELAYAVIEPGVSYKQFNQYLKDHNYKLWADTIDGTPHGSMIGNAMDRGVGETPYGDHFGNICGMEVILPNGKKIHTGGSSPNYQFKTWHLHKWGVGPYIEGMFSQSNLGIVTKAGIWLMPEPEAFVSYIFEVKKEEDFSDVVDAFKRLALQGIVNTKMHMVNDFVSFTVITQKRDEEVEGKSCLTDQDLENLRQKYKVSPWSGTGGLYGTKAEIRVQKRIMKKELGKYGRLIFINDHLVWVLEKLIAISQKNSFFKKIIEFCGGSSLTLLESVPYVHRILQGIPTDYFVNHAYFKHPLPRPTQDIQPARDQCGLIWFAPLLPMTGHHNKDFLERCKKKFKAYGFDFYVAMLMLNPRSIVPLMSIIFDRETEREKARELYDELLELQYEQGYQQYRAGITSWKTLFSKAPEYAELNNQIKKAVDPNNIFAPGKYGIGGQ